MTRLGVVFNLLFVSAALSVQLAAQDAELAVTVPVRITGNLLSSRRTLVDDPTAGRLSAGFRVLARPQLKLGSNLYVYSAIQVRSIPFTYQDRYSADRHVVTRILQAFLGYTHSSAGTSVVLKLGKLTSAFGAFPPRYDDEVNPLLDQPLSYNYLKLRPDQLPCGVGDLRQVTYRGTVTSEPPPDVSFLCGGAVGESYGIAPATLYGIQGGEIGVSSHRLDARLQLTNSSPANPRGAFASSQHPQWTAGGGYTIWQGFRIGMSAFRGPWLNNVVKPYLPAGSSIRDFQAAGLGVDAQWARGPWSISGEWERFSFQYPGFVRGPVSSFAYVELKRTLGPRWYTAVRANDQQNNRPEDLIRRSSAPYRPNTQAYEVAVGFRPNRFQLLKAGYEWAKIAGSTQGRDDVIGIQFVTSIDALSKILK